MLSGCVNTIGKLDKTIVIKHDVEDINITKMKNDLSIQEGKLNVKKNVKGKYLLIIKDKTKTKKSRKGKGFINNVEQKVNENDNSDNFIGNKTMKSMVITDGKQDVLGGKMICTKQAILYRMSRSEFISCIEKHGSKSFSYWFENYKLMNLEELSLIKHGDITSKCNKQNIGSYIDRTVLKSCLQDSLNEGRFIYRNPSSTLIKFNFKEEQ